MSSQHARAGKYAFDPVTVGTARTSVVPDGPGCCSQHPQSLSLTGSNQAREGRLVDALAARGDEGRDTLR